MTVLDSSLYLSDLDRTEKSLDWLELPKNIKILITGATGLICSSVVDLLVQLNLQRNLNLSIILAGRNEKKMKDRFFKYFENNYVSFLLYDAAEKCDFPIGIDYIIHGAGNAFPKIISVEPVETLRNSIISIHNILEYAKKNKTHVLYISSSEVYGQLQNCNPIKENEYGYVDILNFRSCYPIGKRAAETLCTSFFTEYSVESVIVRPGHIYGPTASEIDNRVSSQFMYNAAKGENIVLKSDGQQLRSYCYCLDCASAIIVTLFLGKIGEAYNISNKNSICSIREMAENYAIAGSVKCIFDIPKEKEKKAFNPMLNSSLNSEKLEALGWKPVFSKQEGFEHTIFICKSLI